MLKGCLGRQALSLRRGILSLNQDRHLCQGATCSGQGLSILGARVAPYSGYIAICIENVSRSWQVGFVLK